MTPRSSPLSWGAFALGLLVVGRAALGAGPPDHARPARGEAAPEPGSAPSTGSGPDAGALDPVAEAAAALEPGALAVRYGGDVDEARRTLGTATSAADFERMRALGVDAVVLDCRIDAGSGGKDAEVTMEGDGRVRAAADQARSAGLRVILWPIVVASPSGSRLDDRPGLLEDARLRREQRLRVAAARAFGSMPLVALDGWIGSVEEVKGHTLDESRSRLGAWRAGLGEALGPREGGAGGPPPERFAVLLDENALADAAGGGSGIPDDWGLGVWITGAEGVDAATLGAAVAGLASIGGPRLELLSVMYEGRDPRALVDLAHARDEHAPDAALVIGTWRYGGGGALDRLAPGVWEALAR